MQLATGELERRLRVLAPDIDDDVIRDVMTARRSRAMLRRARAEPIICATCYRPMVPVAMGGAAAARCDTDDQLWFDAPELERIAELVGARHHSQRSWLARLFAHLFAS